MTTVNRPEDIPESQRPPHAMAWGFLIEQWDSGLFTVTRDANGDCIAHFADDGTSMPIADMGYNSEIGLFQRSAFPDELDEDVSQ